MRLCTCTGYLKEERKNISLPQGLFYRFSIVQHLRASEREPVLSPHKMQPAVMRKKEKKGSLHHWDLNSAPLILITLICDRLVRILTSRFFIFRTHQRSLIKLATEVAEWKQSPILGSERKRERERDTLVLDPSLFVNGFIVPPLGPGSRGVTTCVCDVILCTTPST